MRLTLCAVVGVVIAALGPALADEPQPPWHFTTWLDLLDHWQTLLAGVLAVLAAWRTIWATTQSANREVEASQAQTAVAQKQIETTIRLERERVSSEVDALRKSLAVEIRQYIDILITTRGILRRSSRPEKQPMLARDWDPLWCSLPPLSIRHRLIGLGFWGHWRSA